MLKNMNNRRTIFFLFIITYFISCVAGLFLNTIIFTDETGTLGNVAALCGYDWSTAIKGNGMYYKYGQSLFYLPVFLLFKNSTTIFKGVQLVNSLLISLIPCICYKITQQYCKFERKSLIVVSFLTGILPSTLLISKYAWAESSLLLMPWLVILLLTLSSQCGEDSRRKKFYSMLSAFFAVYAYMSHQRGIVLVIGTIITVLFIKLYYRKNIVSFGYFIVALLFMLVLDKCLSMWFFDLSFGADTVISANTLSSSVDLEYLSKIFTPYGFWILIKGISGWVFAIVTETYGIVLFGVYALFNNIVNVIKDKERKFNFGNMYYLFSALVFVGAFAMGILFFYKEIYMYYTWELINRADRLFYTRYVDSVVALLCLPGFIYLLEKKESIKNRFKLAGIFVLVLLVIFFERYVAPIIDGVPIWLSAVLGIGAFIDSHGYESGFVGIANLSSYLLYAVLFSGIIFIVLLYLKNKKIVIALLCVVFLGTYASSFYNLIYRVNSNYYSTANIIVNTVDQFQDIDEKYKYIYMDSEYLDLFRESIQFQLKDYHIIKQSYLYDSGLYGKEMFMFAENGNYNMELYDNDYYEINEAGAESGFRIYVKGDRLNQELNAMGIETKKVILE